MVLKFYSQVFFKLKILKKRKKRKMAKEIHTKTIEKVLLYIKSRLIIDYKQFHAYCLIWASKKFIQPSSAFPPVYRDFYRLLIATSIDHKAPTIICSFN